jgi:hypothetical protein
VTDHVIEAILAAEGTTAVDVAGSGIVSEEGWARLRNNAKTE